MFSHTETILSTSNLFKLFTSTCMHSTNTSITKLLNLHSKTNVQIFNAQYSSFTVLIDQTCCSIRQLTGLIMTPTAVSLSTKGARNMHNDLLAPVEMWVTMNDFLLVT